MPRTRKYNIQIWDTGKKRHEVEQIEEDAKNKVVDLLHFLNIPFTVTWLRETNKSKKSSTNEENTKTTSGIRIRRPRRSESTPIDFIKPPSTEEIE